MGKKPTVGGTAAHSLFAREMTAYLEHVRRESGLSVRGISAQTEGTRSNSWWAEVFNGKKILTTNDIHYIATELMGIDPYRFVQNAKSLALGEDVPPVRFIVGGLDDDERVLSQEEESLLRQSDLELAAYRGRNEAEMPHAE